MSSLQRSSVSFRRQGSSGRIWNDLQFPESKSQQLVPFHNEERLERNLETEETNCSKRVHNSSPSSPSSSVRSTPTTKGIPEQKVHNQGCGISSIFRRCMCSTA
ncbi:hypothetical protein ACFE04_009930 [Oxalis oulophora]